MSHIKLSDHQVDPAALIRNEPVQARSTARLAALLDAAAEVIDEIGYERLTTAMVADRAGASIGTVYRYFPDRIAVLQSLAARNAERMNERVMAAVRDEQHDDWFAALSAGVAVLVDAAHQCMTTRGIRKPGVFTITSRFTGRFKEDSRLHDRFMQMIRPTPNDM